MQNDESVILSGVNRTRLSAPFLMLLDALGYDEMRHEEVRRNGFIVRPFNWGDCTGDHDGDGYAAGCTCPVCRPNFEHTPSGFKLWWYKYPLRAAESNAELTREMVFEWIKEVQDAKQ